MTTNDRITEGLARIERLATDRRTDVPLSVGDRFVNETTREFTDDGVFGWHDQDLLCEVTATDPIGFSYRVLDVVAERNRPSFAYGNPTGGDMAWFGWDAAVYRGSVRRV